VYYEGIVLREKWVICLRIRLFRALAQWLGKNTSLNEILQAQNKMVVSDWEWILVLFFSSHVILQMINKHRKLFPDVLISLIIHRQWKKHNFQHIAITVTSSNIVSSDLTLFHLISIKTIEKGNDRGRQFRFVICFRDLGRLRVFVCELFPITKNQPRFSACDKA